MESKVRSIYSSLAIENNNLSMDTIFDIICFNKKVIGNFEDIQEVKNANELYNQIKEYNWKEEIYLTQEDYYKSIEDSHNNGNANSFINYILKTIYNYLLKTTQKTTQKINGNQKRIIELIEKNTSITRKEIAKVINITEDGVKYNLNRLKKNKIIERIGPDKGGHWTINKRSDNYEI